MHIVTPTVYARALFSTLRSVCAAGGLNLHSFRLSYANMRSMLYPVRDAQHHFWSLHSVMLPFGQTLLHARECRTIWQALAPSKVLMLVLLPRFTCAQLDFGHLLCLLYLNFCTVHQQHSRASLLKHELPLGVMLKAEQRPYLSRIYQHHRPHLSWCLIPESPW